MPYKAFISYSHAADGNLAPAIQYALHRIAKPWYRLRSMRIFRDQTNLSASPGLWSSIESALRDSEFFLFMASPMAAQSIWVQKEVDWWLSNRSAQSFLIILTEGELAWDNTLQDFDWSITTALPHRLSKAFNEEPLYIDLRWVKTTEQFSVRHSQFRPAILELAAPLLGRSKDELDGDDIREHRRTRQITQGAVASLVILLVAAVLAAIIAVQQRDFATSRALASSAEAVLPKNPELALLLANEALKVKADDQARYVLRESFVRHPQRLLHAAARGRTVLAAFLGTDFIISADRDGHQAIVWSMPEGKRIANLPTDSVGDQLAVSRSADGAFATLQRGDDSFALYGVKDWRHISDFQGSGPRLNPQHNRLLATVDGQVHQWELPSGKPVSSLIQPANGSILRDISADGRLLLITDSDDNAPVGGWIISAESGALVVTLPKLLYFEGTIFSPDSKHFLASKDNDESVLVIWDARNGRQVRALKGEAGWVEHAAWSPDGRKIITGSRDGTPRVWSVETGELLAELSFHSNRISQAQFSRDGKVILSASVDGTACLWDAESLRCLAEFGGRGDDLWDAKLAADGLHFLTTHMDGSVRLWNRETWYPIQATQAKIGLNVAAVSNDARFTVTVSEKGRAQLWDTSSGVLKTTLGEEHEEVTRVALNPSGTIIAIAPANLSVQLWDVKTGAKTRELGRTSGEITALAFSPNGEGLLSGSFDGALQYWNVTDGSTIKDLTNWTMPQSGQPGNDDGGLEASIRDVAFGLGGETVVIATGSVVQIRQVATGKVLLKTSLTGEQDFVNGVDLSTDGHSLCIAGGKAVQIWDVTTARVGQTLTGFNDEVFSCAFSPDGRFLATGSGYLMASGGAPPDGNEVRVWDIKTGRDFLRYRSAAHVVYRVFFGSDTSTIIAASMDGLIRKYRCEVCAAPVDLEKLAKSRISRDFSAEERSRYFPDDTLLSWIGLLKFWQAER